MRGVDLALGLSQKFMDILVRYIATHLELHDLDISPDATLNYLINKVTNEVFVLQCLLPGI